MRASSLPCHALEEWLARNLEAVRPGGKLPTDRELAARFGLSERTVRRVLSRLSASGLVIRIRGRGTFAPGGQPRPSLSSLPARSSAGSIADEVYKAVCAGELKPGERLPSVKAMAVQFGVSVPTVIRAYRELASQGHVTRIGKGFWIGRFTRIVRQGTRRRIYLVGVRSGDFAEVFQRDMLAPAYRRFERELSAHGCVMVCVSLADVRQLVPEWRRHGVPQGVVFHGVSGEQYDSSVGSLAAELRGMHPAAVVLVDDLDDFRRDFRGLRVLTRGTISTAVAREAARYVVSAGYRGVRLFFEALKPYDPSTGRLWNFWSLAKIRTELKALNGTVGFRMAMRVDGGESQRSRVLATLAGQLAPGHQQSLLGKYGEAGLGDIAGEVDLVDDLGCAMVAQRGTDLWLFASHRDSVSGLQQARASGLRVPERLSVLSLEDGPAYYHHGVSYCEPDWDSIGFLMAHAVLGDMPVARTARGFLRTGARVVEKLTTRPSGPR